MVKGVYKFFESIETGLNIESLYKNWIDSVSCSCVVPLRKEL